jgi:hypothetical protein
MSAQIFVYMSGDGRQLAKRNKEVHTEVFFLLLLLGGSKCTRRLTTGLSRAYIVWALPTSPPSPALNS